MLNKTASTIWLEYLTDVHTCLSKFISHRFEVLNENGDISNSFTIGIKYQLNFDGLVDVQPHAEKYRLSV